MNGLNGNQNWFMYQADYHHSGNAAAGSGINSNTVANALKAVHTLHLDGPVLSVPAVVDGYVYTGVANSHKSPASNGGNFYKINIETGVIEKNFQWNIQSSERDSHGFTGMGCTPAVVDGRVYFIAFNGKLYCLDQETLEPVWITDLRNADLKHNQPVSNILGPEGYPVAAGWSSPIVVNGRVYVGMGEGENPGLYGFVYCLDAGTGKAVWIYCTCQFNEPFAGKFNPPNLLPPDVVAGNPPPPFKKADTTPKTRGCSVWSSIAYDKELNRLFFATGNPVPDGPLPSANASNGLYSLDAETGECFGFQQIPAESSYRPTDIDVDIGASPTIYHDGDKTLVGIGCKNGCYMIVDAKTMQMLRWRQVLPHYNDNTQIPTVDPHTNSSEPNPRLTNEASNSVQGENFSGIFSTAAYHQGSKTLFVGIGGSNDNLVSPGIDSPTTPFMRALRLDDLQDAWQLDDNNPKRYLHARPPMYTTPGECGLGNPSVVNDLVFMGTTHVSLYAFHAQTGKKLWQDDFGAQTKGLNGGYGFCFGAAVWKNYVAAGALINGKDGGVLKIYKLQS